MPARQQKGRVKIITDRDGLAIRTILLASARRSPVPVRSGAFCPISLSPRLPDAWVTRQLVRLDHDVILAILFSQQFFSFLPSLGSLPEHEIPALDDIEHSFSSNFPQ